MRKVLLKLSGEACGSNESNIDAKKLAKYVEEIKKAKETKDVQVGIVIGGGNFFRGRNFKELAMDRTKIDYMGMMGTVMNAVALSEKLNQMGVKAKAFSMLTLPVEFVEPYEKEKAVKALNEGYVCIYGGGTGKPGFSTDTASLLRAVDTDCEIVLMAKNGVDGVYSDDPKTNKNAVKYDILSHREILDKQLNVMDLDASKIAEDNDIDILVFDMDAKDAITKAILGTQEGTIIKKEI